MVGYGAARLTHPTRNESTVGVSAMTMFIRLLMAACLVAGASAASAQELTGTLKKAKDSGSFTIGYRETSVPLSYLDDKAQPIGFSIELCQRVVDAVKSKTGRADLKAAYNPVNS